MTHDSYTYYMDDFGTRTVCGSEVNISSRANEFSFSLGGIIVKKSDVSSLAADVKNFFVEKGILKILMDIKLGQK